MQIRKTNSIYLIIAFMAALATAWLSYEFWRLLWQPIAANGAVDLLYRYDEVTGFVAGIPVYWEMSDAVYPPASYLMMWPLIGWLPADAVRPVWALTTVACLGILIAQILYIVQPKLLSQKVFLSLLPLCTYATGAAIGNGQIVIHLLSCLLGSLILLRQVVQKQKNRSGLNSALIAFLMLLALVKPNVAAPFFWILVFKAPLSAAISVLGYGFLTVFSAFFQPEFDGPIHLFKAWLNMGMAGVYYGATPYVEYEGGGSISSSVTAHSVVGFLNFDRLDFLEFSGWNQTVSLGALIILGIWTYYNRTRDVWVLASVAAIASKYWTYHGWYDDLILLIPMLVLFNLSAWQEPPLLWDRHPACPNPGSKVLSKKSKTFARILFVAMFLVMLAPGGAYLLPQPGRSLYLIFQTLTLLCVLLFMVFQTPKRHHIFMFKQQDSAY